ncbi:MAG: leucine-rich repeat domain-containing protein, partial [Deltaproteobacteria bacterium]
MDRAKANKWALWTIAFGVTSAIFVGCRDWGTAARSSPVKSASVQQDEAVEKKLASDGESTVGLQKAARHPETALPASLPEATKQSVVALRRMGAWVFVEEDGPKTSISVNFLGPRVRNPIDITPAALKHLQNLTNLEEVYLGRSAISDDQLAVLGGITTLTDLSLNNTRVTDAGLAHLARLDRLNDLGLADTRITDAGLQHLRGMKDLSGLSLEGTGVTDVGLRSLKDLSHLRDLDLSSTKVTDKGLANLAGLRLHSLRLNDTRVTNAGLTHLKGMDELVQLELYDTQVTDAGLEQLRQLGLRKLDVDNVFIGSTIAENPTVLTPVPEEQVARVDEVLWWLPPDSETICVVQAPFPLDWLKSQSDLNAINNLRPGSPVFGDEKYDALLAGKRIALFVSADRHFRLAK